MDEEEIQEVADQDPALVGEKAEAKFEEAPAGFVKKSPLTEEVFDADPATEQLNEAREREVQLSNFIGQQAKLIENLQKAVDELRKDVRGNKASQDVLQAEMLKKTGTRKEGDNLYQEGPSVTPPSEWNIPSREPVLTSEEEEGEGRVYENKWTGKVPQKVKNPHRQAVRINDLKVDKDAEGLLMHPFEVVDLLADGYPKDKIANSRGLKYALNRGMLIPAEKEEAVGMPETEPDSLQKRLASAIGKVPRRGKVKRNAKTGKLEKEQGISDPALEAAATQHIQQDTIYDKALREQREFEESGSNIV